jgi:hypothetical protein
MDNERSAGRALRAKVVPEQTVGRSLSAPPGGDAQEARRLVDDEEIIVLVHEVENWREGDRAVPAESDPIGLCDLRGGLAHDAPVDLHAPVGEPLLAAAAGGSGEERAQPFSEDHRLLTR